MDLPQPGLAGMVDAASDAAAQWNAVEDQIEGKNGFIFLQNPVPLILLLPGTHLHLLCPTCMSQGVYPHALPALFVVARTGAMGSLQL